MDLKKRIAIGLSALLLAVSFSACATGGGESVEETETRVPETAEPIDSALRNDYTDDETTRDAIEALQSSFVGLEEASAEAFSYVLENGAITITKYNGEAAQVRVPERIDGAPVVAIADAAFSDSTALRSLYLPDGIQTVGEGILASCKQLEALRTPCLGANAEADWYLGYLFGAKKYADNPVAVPASLAYLELSGMEKLPNFALFDCHDLVCVKLSNSIREIGTYAFYNCSRLQAINVEHLQTVGEHAFDSCRSLTVLEFGESLSKVGLGALEGCRELRNLTLPFVGGGTKDTAFLGYLFGAEVPEFSNGYYPPYLTRVTLLSTCKTLANNAFLNCEPLLAVELPETLVSIGTRAFAGCVRLSEIALPASVSIVGDNAFFGCLGLERVIFAEGSVLNSLGMNAFYNCSALKAIALPQSLKALPNSCFAGCLSLETADLGGVVAVGKNAFRHCQSLKTLTVQSNVTFESGNTSATRLLEDQN